jgi:DNA-directed RNA polymerase specialized sigma24 family protein
MSSGPVDPSLDTSTPQLPPDPPALEPEPLVAEAVEPRADAGGLLPRLADAPFPVSREQVRAYLERWSTHSLIRRVIRTHVARKTPRHVRQDIYSDAYTRMLEAKQPPPSEKAIDGWATRITARAAIDFFRSGASDMRWLRRDVEVEEQRGESPEEEIDPEDEWLLTNWLREQVKDDPADRETLEIILLKAKSERTYDDIAADRKTTPAAISNRIYRLKLKYLPVRHRHEQQRNKTLMLWLLGVGVVSSSRCTWRRGG